MFNWISRRRVRNADAKGDLENLEQKNSGLFRLSPLDTSPTKLFCTISELANYVDDIMPRAEKFFEVPGCPSDVIWTAQSVSFESLVQYERKDRVYSRYYGNINAHCAAIIIPHWNSRPNDYALISKILGILGITTFVITLPYHGSRGDGGPIANRFLNADVGGSINSVRHAVVDVRSLTKVLKQRGFKKISYIGISLGSCIAALAATFESDIKTLSLLLTAGDFAQTVWTGTATRHIRRTLEGHVTIDELRDAWKIISPSSFVSLLAARNTPIFIVLGEEDHVVEYALGQKFVKLLEGSIDKLHVLSLPCGHYSIKLFPFGVIAFFKIAWFISRSSGDSRPSFQGASEHRVS